MSLESRKGGVRESLIFRNPEQARSFQESYERRVEKHAVPGTKRDKELLGEELVQVFEHEGVGVTPIREPWEHSPEEHKEVQALVETAFSDGLDVAIAKAKTSEYFPRNIDLLHDVLTGRLYDAVIADRVNEHYVSPKVLFGIFALFAAIVVAVIVFVYSL
ncbi:MAG: hypothetical protein K8Q97_02610 [Candidatus Andersenbacteria bacterium]|nr:hypothetical protein [Candidatus Andersenbacteria bacterium]